MREDLEQQLETWMREHQPPSVRAAFIAGVESQQARIAELEAERDRLMEVGRAADLLNEAWNYAIEEMDDDNIVPVTRWIVWMKAHRDLEEALDALPNGALAAIITPKEESRG